MAIPRFFKLPKHRTFDYQPLYYDPKKEEREERNKAIEREMGINNSDKDEGYRPTIQKGYMRSYFHKNKRATRQSNVRLALIIVFLLFVAYLLLYR